MAINESCTSAQTFCRTAQTVGSRSDLAFTYNPAIISQDTKIQATIWNTIIAKIKDIYNYGIRGTRNPINPLGITSFKSVSNTASGNETSDSPIINTAINSYTDRLRSKEEIISKSEYDKILNSIGLTPPSTVNIIITKEQFDTIKTAINNISLNRNRCNNCNSGCNTSCQVNCNTDCYTCPDCYNCGECYSDCYSKCEGTACSSTYCINYM